MKLTYLLSALIVSVVCSQGTSNYEDDEKCIRGYNLCERAAIHAYARRSREETVDKIRKAGPRRICRDAITFRQCAAEKISVKECANADRRIIHKNALEELFDLIDYLCGDILDAVEENWDCFFDSNFEETMFTACNRGPEGREHNPGCSYGWFTNCVSQAVNTTSACQPGSYSLAMDVATRAVRIPFALYCDMLYQRGKPIPEPY